MTKQSQGCKESRHFFFLNKHLSKSELKQLDTALIRRCRQYVPILQRTGVDGMEITTVMIDDGDTGFISLFSPHLPYDPGGHTFSENLMISIKHIFNDTIVSQYFDDIHDYIDTSASNRRREIRKIDRLRRKKYNWISPSETQPVKTEP